MSATPVPRDRPVPAPGAGVPAGSDKRAPAPGRRGFVRRLLGKLGPGLVTGASDDDPSGIGTYAVAGAALGYLTLWTALVTFPLMAAVQYVCAKVGMVTGRGVAGVLRQHYPRALLYPVVLCLLLANTINAGVDVGAIAAGLNLYVPLPVKVLAVPVAVAIVALQVWGSYRLIARVFKWLTLALLAYIGAALFARPDPAAVLRHTFVPTVRFDSEFLMALVAILGTTISPYLFFWQASHEVEEKRALLPRRLWLRRGASDKELRYAFWDVNLGMFFSNVVMYFIILASAATLHPNPETRNVETAEQMAVALEPLAGGAATLLLTLGLVGAGVLAVPVLTGSSAYAVCEAFGWPFGLDKKLGQAKAFYALIVGSTLAGVLVNFVGVHPVRALFWTSVLNGILAPPLLVVILLIANNRAVLGERVNGRALNVLGWATAALMFAAAVGLFVSWGRG
jgi:NRAMP (natural resistance-associated macrophage protein)-like metal ion transporter